MIKRAFSFVFRPLGDAFYTTKRVASLSRTAANLVGDRVAHAANGGLVRAVTADVGEIPPAPAHVFARLRALARVAQIIAVSATAWAGYWSVAGDATFVENLNFAVFAGVTIALAAVTAFAVFVARGGEKPSFLRFLTSPGEIVAAPWR
jgi:hypothetical protein